MSSGYRTPLPDYTTSFVPDQSAHDEAAPQRSALHAAIDRALARGRSIATIRKAMQLKLVTQKGEQ